MSPIAISISPNTQNDDVLLALKVILSPLSWKKTKHVAKLEKRFSNIFGKEYTAFSVNAGRSALYVILKSLGIKEGSEVLVQAFNCVSVPNSVLWVGATPVFVDVDETYNMNPDDIKKKITKKTRAIVVQHTFGIPANIIEIKKIAKKHGIYLIEDCAHSLGATWEGKLLGTFGDVSFFSFGRDKVISSVFGGMMLTKSRKHALNIEKETQTLKEPGLFWTFQQLLHPLLFSLILPLYNVKLGKVMLVILQQLKVLSRAIYKEEKCGKKPDVFPQKMSPALAILAGHQLTKLQKYNEHRRNIYEMYKQKLGRVLDFPPEKDGSVWLRVPVRSDLSVQIFETLKNNGILLGNWYKGVIMPAADPTLVGYIAGSCLNAEEYAKTTVNLPTYPRLSVKQANHVIDQIKTCINTK